MNYFTPLADFTIPLHQFCTQNWRISTRSVLLFIRPHRLNDGNELIHDVRDAPPGRGGEARGSRLERDGSTAGRTPPHGIAILHAGEPRPDRRLVPGEVTRSVLGGDVQRCETTSPRSSGTSTGSSTPRSSTLSGCSTDGRATVGGRERRFRSRSSDPSSSYRALKARGR